MVLLFLKFFCGDDIDNDKGKNENSLEKFRTFQELTRFLHQPLCLQFSRFIVLYTNHLHFSNDYILPQWFSIAVTEEFSVEYKAFLLSIVSHTFESWHTLLLSLENLFFFPHLSNSNLTFNTQLKLPSRLLGSQLSPPSLNLGLCKDYLGTNFRLSACQFL